MTAATLEKRTVKKFNSAKYQGEFALYRKDKLVMIGTIQEIAKARGVHVDSIQYYLTDAYKRKIAERGTQRPISLVPLDYDIEDL